MPAPKKSKTEDPKAYDVPPLLKFRTARNRMPRGGQSPGAASMAQIIAAQTPKQCQQQLADFLWPKHGESGQVDDDFTDNTPIPFDQGLAVYAVALLAPQFDAEEFRIIFRRSLPVEDNRRFSAGHANVVLKWLCEKGIIRRLKAANSRSMAVYGLVRRLRRPREARS